MNKPCKDTFKYPSYECYNDIKGQFVDKVDKDRITTISSVENFQKTYPPEKLENLKKLPKVFNNLIKYLSNNHVFASPDKYNGEGTCKYISYLLCDKISSYLYGECNEEKFRIFKEFVDTYNNNSGSTMCKNMLERLDNKEFLKLRALYQMYDKYYELYSRRLFWDEFPEYCEDVIFLVGSYNTFLNEYEFDSIEFYNILTNFAKLIKIVTDPAESHCNKRHYIGNPRLYEEKKVQIQPPAITTLGPESRPSPEGILNNAHNPLSQGAISSSSMSIREQDIRDPENSHRSEESGPSNVAETFVSQESVERGQPREDLEHVTRHEYFGRQQSHVPRGTYGLGSSYESPGYLKTNETYPLGEDSIAVTEQLKGNGPTRENAGVMTNVQSAISEFMNGVDPVPVVGVSGGMGALFLLFRYTPVGTFFRGGRRINNRIPSRFSGHFPGGFTGYEEFYDGGFGPGPINISYQAE